MLQAMGICPICESQLLVSEYSCPGCGVALKGSFQMCDLCNLTGEQRHFVRVFLKCQGNIKEVERALGMSYPTVKARLAAINRKLGLEEFSDYVEAQNRMAVLRELKGGNMSVEEAMRRIQEGSFEQGENRTGGVV